MMRRTQTETPFMARIDSIVHVLMPAPAIGAQRGSRRFPPPAGQRPPLPGMRKMQGWRCRYGAPIANRLTGSNGVRPGYPSEPLPYAPL
jgi:hypothetical protein